MFENAKRFFTKYERYISPATVLFGFIFDNLTLQRIDVLYSNVLLITYLLVAAACIVVLNVHEHRRKDSAPSETLHFVMVFLMQFCLGGLFSASFLFYSKSGTLIASWPFLLMLIGYIVGNELLRKNYVRLGFQVAVFFTALFSFLIFFFPIIFGEMGDDMFLLSGIASLMVTGFFVYILSWFAPGRTRKSARIITASLIGLFTGINFLYFWNLIPPIPLALKEVGVYRALARLSDGTYEVTGEDQKWFNVFSRNPTFHAGDGVPLYAFSAVFAPTRLETHIVHVWQFYDKANERWVEATRVSLPISGGRDSGFRTFSVKESVFPGKWRVNVETPRGQLIGRLSFTVALPTGEEDLVTQVK